MIDTFVNDLHVLEESDQRNSKGDKQHLCRCLKCGDELLVLSWKLRKGVAKSCRPCSLLKASPEDRFWNTIHSKYRTGAAKRGLSFTVSVEDFKAVATKPCTYCGAEPLPCKRVQKGDKASAQHRGGEVNTRYNDKLVFSMNGLDRVDNSIGYELGNLTPACTMCNLMKWKHSASDFLEHAKRITAHSEQLNK